MSVESNKKIGTCSFHLFPFHFSSHLFLLYFTEVLARDKVEIKNLSTPQLLGEPCFRGQSCLLWIILGKVVALESGQNRRVREPEG
jgi:hypothetical protein